MRKRKQENGTQHKNSNGKQNGKGSHKQNSNNFQQHRQSSVTVVVIAIFVFILLCLLSLFYLQSSPDDNSETNFVTDPSKLKSKRDVKSPSTFDSKEKDDENHEGVSQTTKSADSAQQPNDKNDNSKSPSGIPSKLEEEMKKFKSTLQLRISPKKIFADGRRLPPTELLPQKPNNSSVKVYVYDEFLSTAECDGLMNAHNRHVSDLSKKDPIVCFESIDTLRKHLKAAKIKRKVSPRDFTTGTTCLNSSLSSQFKEWIHSNWSYSTAFYPGESKFSGIFQHRVKEATALQPENGGKFQITSYPLDVGYKTHTDCIENNQDERDRVATILVYLQDVEEGGETQFPELGIWVKPRKGRALVWNNMNEKGKCEHLSLHQAAKVMKGHKYILQRWYYYKSFYSLGKRPPEPHLPAMEPGTPRVSCDEYESGSCRWYDEWNYDHIIEYQNQKVTLI